MNLGELVNEIRLITDDTGLLSVRYTDEYLTSLINEAVEEAARRTNFIFDDSKTITLIDGQATYALPTSTTFVEYVGYENKRVVHQSKHELERNQSAWRTELKMSGKTVKFIARGMNVTFIPAPDATDDTKTVTLEIFRIPETAMSSNSDIPEIPLEFHRSLVWWVLFVLYTRNDEDKDTKMAKAYLDKFTEVFGESVSSEVRFNQFEQRQSLQMRPVEYISKVLPDSSDDDACW